MKYKVLVKQMLHDGKIYKVGDTVEMPDKQAKQHIAAGVLETVKASSKPEPEVKK